MTEVENRPRFYEGQFLSAADLTAAVDYTRTQRARMLLGGHRWGIALGLDLMEVSGPNSSLDVVVQPGYAWDGFGRPIVVSEPAKLSAALFTRFDALFSPGGGAAAPPVPVEIWIRYDELLGQGPRPGFESCDLGSAFSRVTERFLIEAGPRPDLASRRDSIEIAGRTMDASQALRTFDLVAPELADASVPHQVLPEEGQHALWLVPLGVVLYQPGNPGKLVKRDAPTILRHSRSREYAGVVAGSIEASGGVVRVHDRGKPYSEFSTGELLRVEGDLRSDGDVRIFGHKLELIASHAEEPRLPVQVLRRDDPGLGTSAITLVIGDKQAGKNRLEVARQSGATTYDVKMVVTDKGAVGIGTEDPRAPLHIPELGLQIGTGTPQSKNFHVQSNEAGGPRALRFLNGDTGTGTPLMSLTASGRLGVGTADPKAPLHVAEQGVQIGAATAPDKNFHLQSNEVGPRALRFLNGDTGTGTPLMALTSTGRLGVGANDPSNALQVSGNLGIRQNSLYLSGDSRWSSLTFNAHHNESNTAWVFPEPTKPAVTVEMDAIGGFPRFEVFATASGNNQAWQSRLFVNGHSGDVGIGTASPTARLDVAGDVRFAGLDAVGSATKVKVLWGAVGPLGATTAGQGFTVNKTDTGIYEIIFAAAFSAQPVLVVSRVFATLVADSGLAAKPGETAVVDSVGTGRAVVQTADMSAVRVNGGFTFVAIGPR